MDSIQLDYIGSVKSRINLGSKPNADEFCHKKNREQVVIIDFLIRCQNL